ncbi:hypothetical protein SAMN05446934_1958 [Paraburkholderia hospita]|nr:hypothetical protein SAMN05446934_1958 [Paraburkholderia hospita]
MRMTLMCSAQGAITETVEFTDPTYTLERLIEGLKSGTLARRCKRTARSILTASGKPVASHNGLLQSLGY